MISHRQLQVDVISWQWRDAGAVERDSLENCCTGNRTGGSNPPLSAIVKCKTNAHSFTRSTISKNIVENFPLAFMVPSERLELSCPCERQILSLLRLPIPPQRQLRTVYIKHQLCCKINGR